MLKLVWHLLATRFYPHERHLYLRRPDISHRRLRPRLREPYKWQSLLYQCLRVWSRVLAVLRKWFY